MSSLPIARVTITIQVGGSAPSSNPQCSSFIGFIDACQTLTISFTVLEPSAQATCLCYDSQGSFVPDPVDRPALGCYPWAEASDTAYAAELSSAGSLGFCTNNAAAAPSGALPTSAMTSGTLASNAAAPSSDVITDPSLAFSKAPATESGAEGAGGVTESPFTSTTPAPTAAANNPSPSTSSTKSSEACLWINPAYYSAVVSLPMMLNLADNCCADEWTEM